MAVGIGPVLPCGVDSAWPVIRTRLQEAMSQGACPAWCTNRSSCCWRYGGIFSAEHDVDGGLGRCIGLRLIIDSRGCTVAGRLGTRSSSGSDVELWGRASVLPSIVIRAGSRDHVEERGIAGTL
ncbi:hypothetical protein NDU88_006805 [Pleurodeles waltl]|uniref:Uncharacterized protein n=1 Tax=Pleurodeles waltl TaxID=8319 RepID=A0AAV7X247_PLEWA|nr:hypothetical protein NDU88_006805 [Pleurodeles waltl]